MTRALLISPFKRMISITLLAISLTLAMAVGAGAEPYPEAILARAKVRAASEIFSPFRYRLVTHTWVHNGQDELEHEELSREEYIQWTPDSTQTISEEVELIFTKAEEPEERKEGKEEGKEKKLELNFDFLSPERVAGYKFKFLTFTLHEGERVAEFEMKPRKRKEDHWRGSLFLDPETGALRAVDIEPAKGRFGMKRMRVQADFAEMLGVDMPLNIDLEIEAKIILIFHAKIKIRIDFTLVGPVG